LTILQVNLNTLSKYINDRYDDVDEIFYTTVFAYLEKFLVTADQTIEDGLTKDLLKHKVEICGCLMLSKMESLEEQEAVFSMESLSGLLQRDNVKEMSDYFSTKFYELKLFEHKKNL